MWLCFLASLALGDADASSLESVAPAEDSDIWAILDEQRDASNVVVSATKVEQRISETPAAVVVVTQQEILARGYRSVGEAVRALAGVFVADDQMMLDVSLRGINGGLRGQSNTLKVMIDGHSMGFRPDTTNFLGPELVPLEVVERIELIRGPASAVYGANAFLGVINVVTKAHSPNASVSSQVDGQYRLQGLLSNDRNLGGGASASLSYRGESWSMLVAAQGAYEDHGGLAIPQTFARQSIGIGQITRRDQKLPKSGLLRLTYDAGEVGQFVLDSSLSHLDTYAKLAEWSVNSAKNRLSLLNGFARLRYSRPLGEDWALRSFVSLHSGGPVGLDRLDIGDPASYLLRDLDHLEVAAGVEVDWQALSWLRASFAADFAHDNQKRLRYVRVFTQNSGTAVAGDRVEQASRSMISFNNLGASLQLLASPLDWLSCVAGFRFDYNSGYGEGYSPRFGVVVHPFEWLSTKLLYGRSFKPPTGVQLSSRPALPIDITANAALRPQTADTLELIAAIDAASMLKFQATGFALWVHDQIVFERFGISNQARNTSSVTSVGVEGEVRWQSHRVDAFVTLTMAQARSQNALDATLNQTQRVPATPIWFGSAGVLGRAPEAYLQLYAEVRFSGDRLASVENVRRNTLQAYSLAPYAVVDLCLSTLGLKLFGFDSNFSLRVQNLLATAYQTVGYGGFDAPNMMRSFELSFRQAF